MSTGSSGSSGSSGSVGTRARVLVAPALIIPPAGAGGALSPAAAALGPPPHAPASARSRVEILEISGVIDGPTERAVGSVIGVAEQERAHLVVLEIDSPGNVSEARLFRMIRRVASARIPVVAWVGPAGASAREGAAALAAAAPLVAIAPGATI